MQIQIGIKAVTIDVYAIPMLDCVKARFLWNIPIDLLTVTYTRVFKFLITDTEYICAGLCIWVYDRNVEIVHGVSGLLQQLLQLLSRTKAYTYFFTSSTALPIDLLFDIAIGSKWLWPLVLVEASVVESNDSRCMAYLDWLTSDLALWRLWRFRVWSCIEGCRQYHVFLDKSDNSDMLPYSRQNIILQWRLALIYTILNIYYACLLKIDCTAFSRYFEHF